MTADFPVSSEGRQRLEAVLRARPGKPLEHGDTLLFHHALRCHCSLCKRLIDWDNPEGDTVSVGECCGLRYRLLPRTVAVEVEDISSRPILPALSGSEFSDPAADLTKLLEGKEMVVPHQRVGKLSESQKRLRSKENRRSLIKDPVKVKLKLTFGEARKLEKLK